MFPIYEILYAKTIQLNNSTKIIMRTYLSLLGVMSPNPTVIIVVVPQYNA
jgi:hypothetical protein